MKKIKLFCIPYSGSSASVYLAWKKDLPEYIELVPIELLGHGARIKEQLYKNVEEAVEDVTKSIASHLSKDEPYAILGHSMGSALAYEAYYKLKELGYQEPVHMFFSGRKAPIDCSGTTEFYKKSEEEFLKVVYMYGGTTKAIMDNPELKKLFLPILRADFMIAETYYSHGKSKKLQCDITVTNGREDRSIAAADMTKWDEITDKKCNHKLLPGDHFFLIQNMKMMINVVDETLSQSTNPQ